MVHIQYIRHSNEYDLTYFNKSMLQILEEKYWNRGRTVRI